VGALLIRWVMHGSLSVTHCLLWLEDSNH